MNDTNKYGRTVLMYAAREGHRAVCMELVRCGADLEVKDGDGCTAIMAASHVGILYDDLIECQNARTKTADET